MLIDTRHKLVVIDLSSRVAASITTYCFDSDTPILRNKRISLRRELVADGTRASIRRLQPFSQASWRTRIGNLTIYAHLVFVVPASTHKSDLRQARAIVVFLRRFGRLVFLAVANLWIDLLPQGSLIREDIHLLEIAPHPSSDVSPDSYEEACYLAKCVKMLCAAVTRRSVIRIEFDDLLSVLFCEERACLAWSRTIHDHQYVSDLVQDIRTSFEKSMIDPNLISASALFVASNDFKIVELGNIFDAFEAEGLLARRTSMLSCADFSSNYEVGNTFELLIIAALPLG